MFYASYAEKDGKITGHLFDDYRQYLDEVGSATPIAIVDFKTKGKTYADKQDSVRQVAIEYQHAERGGMFTSEYAKVGSWFRLMGKRYGLLEEFENEGVI